MESSLNFAISLQAIGVSKRGEGNSAVVTLHAYEGESNEKEKEIRKFVGNVNCI